MWVPPTYACSLQMWHHVKKGDNQAFQWNVVYCQEALLPQRNNLPNTHFLTFCAKIRLFFFTALRQIMLTSGTLLKDDIHKVNISVRW